MVASKARQLRRQKERNKILNNMDKRENLNRKDPCAVKPSKLSKRIKKEFKNRNKKLKKN
jgi:hypothetical protein